MWMRISGFLKKMPLIRKKVQGPILRFEVLILIKVLTAEYKKCSIVLSFDV